MPEPLLLQLVANTKLFFDNQTWHNLILWLHYGQRTPAIAVVAGIEIILMGIFIPKFDPQGILIPEAHCHSQCAFFPYSRPDQGILHFGIASIPGYHPHGSAADRSIFNYLWSGKAKMGLFHDLPADGRIQRQLADHFHRPSLEAGAS